MLLNPHRFGSSSVTYADFVAQGGATIAGGGVAVTTYNTAADAGKSDIAVTGKTYVELTSVNVFHMIGVCSENTPFDWVSGAANCAYVFLNGGGNYGQMTGTGSSIGTSTIGLAIDPAAQKIWFRNAGGWTDGDPVEGTGGHDFSGLSGSDVFLAVNNGGVGSGTITATWNVGETAFAFSVPSGFAPGLFV